MVYWIFVYNILINWYGFSTYNYIMQKYVLYIIKKKTIDQLNITDWWLTSILRIILYSYICIDLKPIPIRVPFKYSIADYYPWYT